MHPTNGNGTNGTNGKHKESCKQFLFFTFLCYGVAERAPGRLCPVLGTGENEMVGQGVGVGGVVFWGGG